MCTVVILRRPAHPWPLLLAANRDEMAERPWLPPARHWPDRPDVVAGQDELAGGTWLGVNDHGVVAGILNRRDSLGPDPLLRSRGELVLEALDHADASAAAEALAHLDGCSYRSFNLVIADNRDAYWLKSLGAAADGRVQATPLEEGVSMLTAMDLNDQESARIRHYMPKFETARPPDPETGDWTSWKALLADPSFEPGMHAGEAMNIFTDRGFGTLSSSLIALPNVAPDHAKPVWLFAAGRPGETPFEPVAV